MENMNICDTVVTPSKVVWYLGAWLDSQMNLKYHATMKCKAATLNFRRIQSIRQFLDQSTCEILVCSLVLTQLDYNNGILYGASECVIYKLQKVDNFAAKVVLNRKIHESSLQALHDLHWLPIHARIDFKILKMVYKCLHDKSAQSYLKDLLVANKHIGMYGNLRSNSQNVELLIVPCVKSKTFATWAFSVFGPRLWNSLPGAVRSSDTLGKFKSLLKTHLFIKYVVNDLN